MWEFIGECLWFFLPAGMANIGASMSRFLPQPGAAVDGGRTWRGEPIFGSHKTWRGLIIGVLVGQLTFLLQQAVTRHGFLLSFDIIDYAQSSWVVGLLLAAGAVLGDLVKSFFKRRVGIPPGKMWLPFDQIDYVVGALALVSIAVHPPLGVVAFLVVVGFVLHPTVNLVSYALKLQNNKL